MLKRIRKCMDKDTALMLYKALVVPLLDYSDIIYMTATLEQLNHLQKLQNTACRIILLAEARTHITDMHESLGLTRLVERRHFHLAIFNGERSELFMQCGLPRFLKKIRIYF